MDWRKTVADMVRSYRGKALESAIIAAIEGATSQALESAAQLCDREATEEVGAWRGPPEYRLGATACAAAIRASIRKETP